MSELGPITAFGSNRWEDVEPHLGSTGAAAFGVQVRIVDENKKREYRCLHSMHVFF